MFRSFGIFVAVLFLGASAHASLIGLEFSGELGISDTAGNGPFGPAFISQVDGGSAVVGPGQELAFFGSTADFDADGVDLTFNSSHSTSLDFNGFRYLLLSPEVEIVDVILESTSISGLTQANIFFTANGFAVNAVNQMLGSLRLTVVTNTVSDVPVPAAFVFMLTGIASIAATRRKKKAL